MKKFVPRKCFDFKQIHGCFWPYFYWQIKDTRILSALKEWEWLVQDKYAIKIEDVEGNVSVYQEYNNFISIIRTSGLDFPGLKTNKYRLKELISNFNHLCEMGKLYNAESSAYQTLILINEWKHIRSEFTELSEYGEYFYYDELLDFDFNLVACRSNLSAINLDIDNNVVELLEEKISGEPYNLSISKFHGYYNDDMVLKLGHLQLAIFDVIKSEFDDIKFRMEFKTKVIPELRFLLKLFTSSCCAEKEMKKLLTDNPFPRVLQMLREEIYEETFNQLNNSELGKKYCEFIDAEGVQTGVVRFANYMGVHHKEFSEQDEKDFFYQLDKMRCIVSILSGEIKDIVGKDYEYPDGYFEEEKALGKTIKTDERTNTRFDGFIVCHSQQSNILEVLHQFFDHKKGKNLALYVECAIEAGLITKPTFSDLQAEFNIEGSKNAFNNYLQKGKFCDQEKTPIIAQMKKFG